MINPDFSDRTYTAEVMRTKTDPLAALKGVTQLMRQPQPESHLDEATGATVTLYHGFLAIERDFHRFPRKVKRSDGTEVTIPHRIRIRNREANLYDVLLAQSNHHIIVAVPFHEMAEEFFVQVDVSLRGLGTRYEKLDITRLVVQLGAGGETSLKSKSGDPLSLSVTRCHLTYVDQQGRTSNLQQVRINGANLGVCKEYKSLIAPVLEPKTSALSVTPVVLGFALSANGVKKSSATTDRHGNFKVWVAPGLRRLVRLFSLLDALEELEGVTQVTANVPILQSKTIRDTEE